MAQRKLQAEIDKTLKAVAIGVETFEATFDKLGHASNSTQKDKLENDLKTQIKKLQRMRDQIKAWLGSSDIKDKSALLDNRKLIETQMERFKALEKEMKMKAFSKEGLIAQSKLDPAEKAKRDMIEWVVNTTDELARQIEATEAEIEGMATAKKKKGAGERTGELEELNERRQWHIGRLEIIQRMLENGQLPADQVETIQEDVKYFVESNAEEDFDYDQGLYDDLNLLDEEDFNGEFTHPDEQSLDSASLVDPSDNAPSAPIPQASPSASVVPAPKTPAKEEKEKKATPASKAVKEKKDKDDSALADEAGPPSPVLSKKAVSRKSTMDSSKAELPKLGGKNDQPPVPPVPLVATASGVTPKAALPPIRYAAAAAAAVVTSSPTPPGQVAPSILDSVTSPTRMRTELPTESPAQEKEEPILSPTDSAPPPPPGIAVTRATPSQPWPSPQPPASAPVQPPVADAVPASAPPVASRPNGSAAAEAPPTPSQPEGSAPESSRAGAAGRASPRPPQQQGVLGSLMQSFDVAKEMSERRGNDISQLHQALESSYQNAPLQGDSDPPRYYLAKNPVKTPSIYPQTRATILQDKSVYDRFDVDQLFFIFYYYSGSYEQYLAAQKLKQLNWRFHKQYLTWFKRAHNPQAITEDYEQGGYYYFDWENSWCQRKKSDFRFEYRWLSES